MGGIALFLLLVLSGGLTSLILIIAYSVNMQLHPFWTFLAVFLFLFWMMRRM